MTEAIRIKKNSFFSLISIASRLVANVIVFWLIARIYGPENFGIFTFAHTTATILILLADFGFDILLTTELSKNISDAKNIFQNIFSYKIIFSLVAFSIMMLLALFYNSSNDTNTFLIVFSFFLLFTTLTNFSTAAIRGFEKFSLDSIVSILMNFSLIIFVIVATIYKFNLISIAVIFTFTRLIGFILATKYLRKLIPDLSYKIAFAKNSELQKKVLIFGLNLLFTNLVFQQDTLLISFFLGNKAVGIYQAVFKLIVLPLIIPEILNFSLLPVLSRYFENDYSKAMKLSYLMNKILYITAFPIALIFYLYPAEIVHLLYGKIRYDESIPILKIFAFNIFIRFVFETFGLMLTTSNRQIIRMYTVIAASIISIVLNIVFLPKYGVIAAAYISLITITFIFSIYTIYSLDLFRKWFFNKQNLLIIIISSLILYFSKYYPINSLYIGAALILIVFTVVAFVFYFNENDRKFLFSSDFSFKFLGKN